LNGNKKITITNVDVHSLFKNEKKGKNHVKYKYNQINTAA